MKTILAPTDFSPVAKNAIDYAAEIAKMTQAKLVLFHVYNVPEIPSVIPVTVSADEIEADAMAALKEIENDLQLSHGNELVTECRCRYGVPVDEINLFAKQNNAFLIVMGMESTGYLAEKFIGSTTTSLIRQAKRPVLAIDRSVKFRAIQKIALACDYHELGGEEILKPLREFAEMFKSHVYLLNVVQDQLALPSLSSAAEGMRLDHTLEAVSHSFHYAQGTDVVARINDFVDKRKIDMVVMIPRYHGVLETLFHEPNTKRMAFHTHVPLLALHESK